MSTGGNVPTQGVVIEEATTAKKRGDRGKLGKGSPGKRLKAMWRKLGDDKSLKQFARTVLKSKDALPTSGTIVKEWLASKRPGGSDEQRAIRKEAHSKRVTARYAALAANKDKPKSSKKKKESVSGGTW